MSVQSEIDRLNAAKADLADAIEEQGVDVPAGTKLGGFAALVRAIVGKVLTVAGIGPDGSGNVALKPLKINVSSGSSGGASQREYDGSSEQSITVTTYGAATSGADGLMSKGDKAKLDGIASGANKTTVDSALSSTSTNPVQNKAVHAALAGKAASGHTHTAATTSAAGFLSAADKQRLNAMRVWTIVVPDTAWTTETGGYKATISAPGMTVSTQLISVALSPAYMGLAESEEAARQWTYLDTAADSVVLHAAIKPGAYFGLVLAAMATANPQ